MIDGIFKFNTMQGSPPIETPMVVYSIDRNHETVINYINTVRSDNDYFYWQSYASNSYYTRTTFNKLVSLALNFKSPVMGVINLRSMWAGKTAGIHNNKLRILPSMKVNANLLCSVEYGMILNNVLDSLRNLLNKILGQDPHDYLEITPDQYNRILRLTISGKSYPCCSAMDIKLLHKELNSLYINRYLFGNDELGANYIIEGQAETLTKYVYERLNLYSIFGIHDMHLATLTPEAPPLWPLKLIRDIDSKLLLSAWVVDENKQRWLNYTP